MTLPASGTIKISDIVAEFGGTGKLSEYYRGGGRVPDTPTNSSVPTSGSIKLSNFYGASNVSFTPVTYTYTGSQSGSRSVPSGATFARLRVQAPGGAGGGGDGVTTSGGGGGGGGYAYRVIAVTGGNSLNYNAGGVGGIASVTGTVSGGSVNMQCQPGGSGAFDSGNGPAAGGAGGTASGGTVNYTGSVGEDGGDGGFAGTGLGGAGGHFSDGQPFNTTDGEGRTGDIPSSPSNGKVEIYFYA